MIDYSGCKFAKSRPVALDKADKVKALAAKDQAENAKARARAKGQCEIRMHVGRYHFRCLEKDSQTHHLIYGIGRKNRGKSILAEFKLRVCAKHHAEINAKILQPTTSEHSAYTVRYRRVS